MLSSEDVLRIAEDNGAVYYGDRSGQMGFGTLDVDVEGLVRAAYAAGQAAEREACIEDVRTIGGQFAAECEAAIRARGEKGGDEC